MRNPLLAIVGQNVVPVLEENKVDDSLLNLHVLG